MQTTSPHNHHAVSFSQMKETFSFSITLLLTWDARVKDNYLISSPTPSLVLARCKWRQLSTYIAMSWVSWVLCLECYNIGKNALLIPQLWLVWHFHPWTLKYITFVPKFQHQLSLLSLTGKSGAKPTSICCMDERSNFFNWS